MRTFVALLLTIIVALNCVQAGPVRSPDDDAEVVNVPLRGGSARNDDASNDDSKDFTGVISTNVGYPFLQPEPHPFLFNLGFSDSFEDIFHRLRTHLWPIAVGGGGSDGDSDSDEGFGFNLGSVAKNGTTSTVKVVNGHKIEVNETNYGDKNNVFKVRIVKINPVDSTEDSDSSDVAKPSISVNPVTSAPKPDDKQDNEDIDNRREPLEKNDTDNEVQDNLDTEIK